MILCLDCQLGGIQDLYGNKPLGMSIRDPVDWVELGRPAFNVGGHESNEVR